MDELVKQAIALCESKRRMSVPWRLDEPWEQQCFLYSPQEQEWRPADAGSEAFTRHVHQSTTPTRLALFAWNIDFMLPFPDSRMEAAVRHLQNLIETQPETVASVIYLQECVGSDLELLARDPWIRNTFALTDLTIANWQSGHYGTTTLLDKRLRISKCFRVHYSQTRMERDVLVTDVSLCDNGGAARCIRLCNTHLESLALEPAYRPPQMQLVAGLMDHPGIDGAAVAGDFNAIQDFDRHLHLDNGLKDAFLELGGDHDDAEAGHTWGQQAATVLRERFGTSRMDKVFFRGGLRCIDFERFGADIEVEEADERTEIARLGFDKPWITDHLGIKAVFDVV